MIVFTNVEVNGGFQNRRSSIVSTTNLWGTAFEAARIGDGSLSIGDDSAVAELARVDDHRKNHALSAWVHARPDARKAGFAGDR